MHYEPYNGRANVPVRDNPEEDAAVYWDAVIAEYGAGYGAIVTAYRAEHGEWCAGLCGKKVVAT